MRQKNILFVLLAMFVILVSCSDDEKMTMSMPSKELVKVISLPNSVVEGGTSSFEKEPVKVLSFDDNDKYMLFVNKLREMSHENRMRLFASLGFENLREIEEKADKELEIIGSSSANEDSFRKSYNRYKAKYAGILVNNDVDSTDLTLYIPSSQDEIIAPYIVGKVKKIIVNGKIIDVEFSTKMNLESELLYAKESLQKEVRPSMTRGTVEYNSEEEWPTNGFINVVGHKKTIFSCDIADGNVCFHFGAQKKMWYGWKRDNDRSFFFRTESMVGMTENRDNIVNKTPYRIPTYYFGLYFQNNLYKTGDITVKMGEAIALPSPVIYRYELKGKVFVWTDMMFDKDSSGNVIYHREPQLIGYLQTDFPSLSKINSFPCKIDIQQK